MNRLQVGCRRQLFQKMLKPNYCDLKPKGYHHLKSLFVLLANKIRCQTLYSLADFRGRCQSEFCCKSLNTKKMFAKKGSHCS